MLGSRVHLPRFELRFGYANRLLRVNLSDHTITAEPLGDLAPDYIGGRGLASRLIWDLCPTPVDAFAPENPLMVLAGALTGTRSPYSGRTAICAFSPQAYPYTWFTRASIGAQFGAELKQAGYDGIIVTGAAEEPVQLVIRDDEVALVSANDLWGLDTYDTLDALANTHGKGARSLTIGPAGERLARIATIHTASSSTAGQGGFGAVMGAKKLKAISVVGTGQVRVADPDRFGSLVKAVCHELHGSRPRDVKGLNERLAADRGGSARLYACTAACPTPCNLYFKDMPGVAHPERTYEGHMACVGSTFAGMGEDGPIKHGGVHDWQLGTYGGFEMNVLSNRYGLNQWDIIMGMVPWLERSQWAGLVTEMNGMPMNWQDAGFWTKFLHAIAYREGLGDVLAEGGLRAAGALGLGEDLVQRHYTGWGFGGHWDGHACWQNYLVYPYWLVSALQWSTDTRDPYSSSHGYVQNIMGWSPVSVRPRTDAEVSWEHIAGISRRVYGTEQALSPTSGYEGKAYPAFYHDKRSVMKDSVPTDDQVFPLIYTDKTADRFFRVGEIDGPSVDYQLFRLGTGYDGSEEQFEQAAERVYTLERALNVRHWGRNRTMDESVLPAFEYEENWTNPVLGQKYGLDRQAFKVVQDEYYRYLGWDPETGWPTKERLDDLGIGEVHEPMVAGAQAAEQRRAPFPKRQAIKA